MGEGPDSRFSGKPFQGPGIAACGRIRVCGRHTGRPVLGVVPNLENLGLPEEDSVTFKQCPETGA